MGDVFVTGGSGFVGGALVHRLVAEGRFVNALARSEAAAEIVRGSGGATGRAAISTIRPSLLDGIRGVAPSSTWPASTRCASATRRPCCTPTSRAAAAVVRAASAAKVARLVHTSSAATIGEATGVSRPRANAASGNLPVAIRALQAAGRAKVLALGSRARRAGGLREPVLGAGAGRIGGSSRLLLDLVNGRLPVLVDTLRLDRRRRRLHRSAPAGRVARRAG